MIEHPIWPPLKAVAPPPLMHPSLLESYIRYARFNSLRGLGSPEESRSRIEKIGNSTALVDPTRSCPGVCNRVLGFGSRDAGKIDEIISLYRGKLPQFDLAPERLNEVAAKVLLDRSLRPAHSLSYMIRKIEGKVEMDHPDIRVERWKSSQADEFVRLLRRSGVSCSGEIWNKRREYYCTDSFRTFVAFTSGSPCAWATLFTDGTNGICANAFTFEEFRGRGCQSALLAHRINDAHHLGLTQLATDVLHGSASYRNCRRFGFELNSIHTIWLPREIR